jgi:hypothetical protein
VINIIKKYKYFIIAILVMFLIPITTLGFNDKYVNTLYTQQEDYRIYLEKWLKQMRDVKTKYPIDVSQLKIKTGEYFYKALSEREKVLNSYDYNEEMISNEYIEIHNRVLKIINEYKKGINIMKEGILTGNMNTVEEGGEKVFNSTDLLDKLENDLMLNQPPF